MAKLLSCKAPVCRRLSTIRWPRVEKFATSHICIALVAFVVTFLTVPLAKQIALALKAVDYPGARRINKVPIPRMGGIAIFLGLAAALAVQYFGTKVLGWPPALISHPSLDINYMLLAVSVAVVFATGALDDVFQLSPKAKLAGQIFAAALAVASGLTISRVIDPFNSGAYLELGWVAIPITIVYLVAFSNIINLIDGLDGLATGITGIAALAMLYYALMFGRVDAAALSIALAACCAAFLRYNFNPASIFLGDSGALTLGFLLGVISLLNVSRTAALTSMLIPLIVAGVPIIDTFSAIVRRTRAHVSMGQADKGHLHHRLMQEGYNQRQSVVLIYLWSALLAVGAAVITQVPAEARIVIFITLALLSLAVARHLHLFEPVLRHHYNPKTHQDELITPDDPAFDQEVQASKEAAERRKEELLEKIGPLAHHERLGADEETGASDTDTATHDADEAHAKE